MGSDSGEEWQVTRDSTWLRHSPPIPRRLLSEATILPSWRGHASGRVGILADGGGDSEARWRGLDARTAGSLVGWCRPARLRRGASAARGGLYAGHPPRGTA